MCRCFENGIISTDLPVCYFATILGGELANNLFLVNTESSLQQRVLGVVDGPVYQLHIPHRHKKANQKKYTYMQIKTSDAVMIEKGQWCAEKYTIFCPAHSRMAYGEVLQRSLLVLVLPHCGFVTTTHDDRNHRT
jgi:hypothetical protein